MPELTLFTGGINSRKEPQKLAATESVNITNAIIDGGSIVSIQQPIVKYQNVGSVFTEFNRELLHDDGPYLNFEEQQGRLFKVDGDLPTYSLGKKDANGVTEWYPMGIPTPDEPLTAEVVETPDVIFTVLDPTTNPGVIKAQTDYVYVIVSDSLIYESVFTTAADIVCTSINLDCTAFTGATLFQVYRKVNNDLYQVNTDGVYVFDDFVKSITDVPTGVDRKAVVLDDIVAGGIGISWKGNGTASFVALAENGKETGSINLNFTDGTITGSAEAVSQFDIKAKTRPPGQPGLPYMDI